MFTPHLTGCWQMPHDQIRDMVQAVIAKNWTGGCVSMVIAGWRLPSLPGNAPFTTKWCQTQSNQHVKLQPGCAI